MKSRKDEPFCPSCGSHNLTIEYLVERDEYVDRIDKEEVVNCCKCFKNMYLVTRWKSTGWAEANANWQSISKEAPAPKCPSCGSRDVSITPEDTFDFWDVIEDYEMVECLHCGSVNRMIHGYDLTGWEIYDRNSVLMAKGGRK